MKTELAALATALTLSLAGAAMSQTATAPTSTVPANLKPTGIFGPGWNVKDLEAQKAWYMEKLGMRLVQTISRDGKPYEYIMGFDGGRGSPILALLASPSRPEGPNHFSRIILNVPDAKGLADHLKGQGVAIREVIPNVAYFLDDPEGNAVELFTPPAR
jgi:catechol 2,3-dioxygenase-like lactoylglutathione lyase family enzyme